MTIFKMYKVLQSWPKEMDTHNGHNTLCALHNFTNKLVNSSLPLMRLWPVQISKKRENKTNGVQTTAVN